MFSWVRTRTKSVTVAIRITRNASFAFSNTRSSRPALPVIQGSSAWMRKVVSPSVTAPGSAGAGSRRKRLKRLAGRKNGESRQRAVFSEMLVDIAGHVLSQRWERSLQHRARQRPPKPVADIFRDRGSPTLPAVQNAFGKLEPNAVPHSQRRVQERHGLLLVQHLETVSSSNRSPHRCATNPRVFPASRARRRHRGPSARRS
jgi:hypothetical protein